MLLTVALSKYFSQGERSRAYDYTLPRRVKIVSGSEWEVGALVQGSLRYEVNISLIEAELHLECTCPYAEDHGTCKHLWAVITLAERQGYLSEVTKQGRFDVVFDSLDHFDEDEFDDEPFTLQPYTAPKGRVAPPRKPAWQLQLESLTSRWRQTAAAAPKPWPERRQLVYVIDAQSTITAGLIQVELLGRERKASSDGWNKPKQLRLRRSELATVPDPEDREIISRLAGAQATYTWSGYDTELQNRWALQPDLADTLVRQMARSGRLFIRASVAADLTPLAWDDGEPWRFELALEKDPSGVALSGRLVRGDAVMALSEPLLLTDGGLVFTSTHVARLACPGTFPWIAALRQQPAISASDAQADDLIAGLFQMPAVPPISLPREMQVEVVDANPRPVLAIEARSRGPEVRLVARLAFEYGAWEVEYGTEGGVFDREHRRVMKRDAGAETDAVAVLTNLGFKPAPTYGVPQPPAWEAPGKKLPAIVAALLERQWLVHVDGKAFRRAGRAELEISSGIDWFELRADVDFDGVAATLPQLLEAVRRGEQMVALSDGTYGVVPEDWLARIAPLAGLGTRHSDHVRFRHSQAGLLDALLLAQPETRCDEQFQQVRERLASFGGVRRAEQPAGFSGTLRDYQCEGLGWFHFLREFGFGGCLADDMGVGKTAQVLALLETRRQAGDRGGPSLVVAPRSLIFNWQQEAARFTPGLRVHDYTGLDRSQEPFAEADLILTTYGTVRRDAARLQAFEFDYVILDEAQAVKNSSTASAKAVRLLKGRHRLALSGTPVENHLGELWSLFEFLNPGMLGAVSVFQSARGLTRNPDPETLALLSHALRPFILRRTKQQVARELPPKTEQTIFCEMKPAQRKLYDELRMHYRQSLLGRIDKQGLGKSKMHVLEALLRLRQAACHPGLLDPERREEPSAKLDALTAQLDEIREEGHKALVFSQFTSLLDIVRSRLDTQSVTYEYLDGKTRDRQSRVERFQQDPSCGLFLISLKAGGLGLNLTAAEYVFLLDPWWNPAVESQAIDRAHRIGQAAQVFAYRLIARDTVEEKVLELQAAKRDVATAIISGDKSLIADLRREDLELLLS